MERFGFVFLVAGLGFFALAFVVSGWVPLMPFTQLDVVSVEELARHVPLEFAELREQYPEAFQKAFGKKSDEEALAEALVLGRATYIAEGCWHCHSQQVRPVGNDEARFGRVHYPEEFNNALNYPPLWGTRRVGPDLLREGGLRSNDWHVAHFWNPPDVAPLSVMPSYPWFFEPDGLTPNKKGLCLIAYVQWLGSWTPSHHETVFDIGTIERAYPAPKIERPLAPVPTAPQQQPPYEEPDTGYDEGYGEQDAGGSPAAPDESDEYGY